MPALVIGAVTVAGAVSAERTEVEAVERERAYAHNMLATQIAASKASWRVQVIARTAADLATLRAALVATPPVACSGDVLGGSVNCFPEIHTSAPALDIRPLRHSISFTLHEA